MTTGLQLKSKVAADGALSLFLETAQVPEPGPDEVIIQVEATPINPSDLGNLFGRVDLDGFATTGEGEASVLTNQVPAAALPAMKARIGKHMPVGNEGAGKVIAAGSSDAAQALMGKMVSTMAGGMYAQYRVANVMTCLPLKDGTTAVQGCSSFVNPMTALSMIETMRMEGHSA
ncbi:MAG: NADH oxidase, partial [Pseudomonadota bacterium]